VQVEQGQPGRQAIPDRKVLQVDLVQPDLLVRRQRVRLALQAVLVEQERPGQREQRDRRLEVFRRRKVG
jgi:hypothetical protein